MRRRRQLPLLVIAALAGGGCCHCARPTGELAGAPAPAELALVPAFPHVRVDRAARVVEFDARVTPLMHYPESPVVWLEVLVTTPDTKPHETLLVTDAKPSHVHAALLLAGLEAGSPGLVWVDQGGGVRRRPPSGAGVGVRFTWDDPVSGVACSADPRSWAVNAVDGRSLGESAPDGRFVFAGSEFRTVSGRELYTADYEGTLIGLATFGSETVAWSEAYSPESQLDEPVWQAYVGRIPPNDWPVRVRLSAE